MPACEETVPSGGQVDRDAFRTVRRAELLARLELLDGMIDEEAIRVELIREMGWDAAPYEQRSKLLKVTRQHYVALLRQFLLDMEAPDAARGEAPRGASL